MLGFGSGHDALGMLGMLLLHFVFLTSVFDIYFKSPVVKDVAQTKQRLSTPPARRLVLIVADGLRADSLFSSNEAPFLRSMAESVGAWGVSHTHVPTESRPGHVALIAGMYEDPSAITRGWRENPADFDTVFNQSTRTWAWGSPDILPMFEKGVAQNQMKAESYDHSFEDFSSSDPSQLDLWVFERVTAFFEEASRSTDLQLQLRTDGLVFFLHLLGCDTNGHTNKPGSSQYQHNIAVVDEGARRVTELVERYWRQDGRTAFVFTADHGMTDWGSHGTGMPHETQTPLIAWGAGVRAPTKQDPRESVSPEAWRMHDLRRSDVQQADVAPFMSTLIGVNVPKNSMGKLPVDLLDLHPRQMVEANLAVSRQMYEQLLALRSGFESAVLHRPFPSLDTQKAEEMLISIDNYTRVSRYGEALNISRRLFEAASEGVAYYQRYHRSVLLLTTSLSYIGLIVLVALKLVADFTPFLTKFEANGQRMRLLNAGTFFSSAGAILLLWAQSAPLHFVIYYLSPVLVWYFVWKNVISVKPNTGNLSMAHATGVSGFALLIIELIVASFFERRLLAPAILLGTVYQLWQFRDQSFLTKASYVALNIMLCAFTFQVSVGKDRSELQVLLAGLLSVILSQLLLRITRSKLPHKTNVILSLYLCLSGACVLLSSSQWVNEQAWLLKAVQATSWTILLTGVPIALLGTKPYLLQRTLALCMALQATYMLLSLSYEGLLLLVLVTLLCAWVQMEFADSHLYGNAAELHLNMASLRQRNVLSSKDSFRSLFFLLFSVASFFGTGNIASLNSFDPRSIRCLVAVFSPFVMGGLLLLKVLIPFLVVAVFTRLVLHVSRLHTRALALLLLLFSDVMALHFFFLVTDQGSWQEIGTSLSHFVIAQATVIFLQVFIALAGLLLTFSKSFPGSG